VLGYGIHQDVCRSSPQLLIGGDDADDKADSQRLGEMQEVGKTAAVGAGCSGSGTGRPRCG